MAASFEDIGKQFLEHYYMKFDSSRAELGALYLENSMLSFEGEQFLGAVQIMEKLSTFPTVRHVLTKFDLQPSVNNGVVCFVIGDIFIDESENGLKFSQVFHIQPKTDGSGFYCNGVSYIILIGLNDFFRLNIS